MRSAFRATDIYLHIGHSEWQREHFIREPVGIVTCQKERKVPEDSSIVEMLLPVLAYLLIGFFVTLLMTTVKRFILSKVINTKTKSEMNVAPLIS